MIEYRKTFEFNESEGGIFLDLGQVYHVAEVWINGHEVGQSLWGPFVFDVNEMLKPGINRIKVRVGNLLNNSYGDIRPSGLLGPVTLIRKVNNP